MLSIPDTIPYSYCHCGCGRKTRLAPKTASRRRWVKGQPIPFIYGHGSRRALAGRFWSKVTIGSPDECWPWQGSKRKSGHGQIAVNGRPEGAHRIAYKLAKGYIPVGLEVLHSCNNAPCCNPDHLYVGTQLDNIHDAIRAGHAYQLPPMPGCKHPSAKLTDDKVRQIRTMYATGTITLAQLGKQFGVTMEMIWLIIHRKKWMHVP